ncbi:MAG: hypothetical protein IJO28_01650 [Oscillospiraceae bacterium]|nr:hypothetical protein [Oscillospiraceae bacterium]
MDHSVQGHIQRLSSEELETFLQRCMLLKEWDNYCHIVPQILETLELRNHSVPQTILKSWETHLNEKNAASVSEVT